MTHSPETSSNSKRKPINKGHLRVAGAIVVITAIGAAGYGVVYGMNKLDEHQSYERAVKDRRAKILTDASEAAVATVEQQRLNPNTVKVIGGLLVIKSGKILASSPNFLNITSAPGSRVVQPGESIVVMNPKLVNNTYQFADSCTPLPKNKFITSAEVAKHTYWISANVTSAPTLFDKKSPLEPIVIDKNTGQSPAENGNMLNCAIVFDNSNLNLVDDLASRISSLNERK